MILTLKCNATKIITGVNVNEKNCNCKTPSSTDYESG